MNPKAKVVLSVRDNAEAWINSARDTIFAHLLGSPNAPLAHTWPISALAAQIPLLPFKHFHKLHQVFDRKIWLGKTADWSNDESVAKMYYDWIAHVKRIVPKDQLLIYNVKQGWEPLCNFLGVQGNYTTIATGP